MLTFLILMFGFVPNTPQPNIAKHQAPDAELQQAINEFCTAMKIGSPDRIKRCFVTGG